MVLIAFIPVFGLIWAFVELCLLEGTIGPNRYGEDPLQPQVTGTEAAGYGLLDQATRLERDGRIQEALAAYEEIAQKYAHTAAGPDAKQSAESLRRSVD